jgi:carboxyl-terminal processing protease
VKWRATREKKVSDFFWPNVFRSDFFRMRIQVVEHQGFGDFFVCLPWAVVIGRLMRHEIRFRLAAFFACFCFFFAVVAAEEVPSSPAEIKNGGISPKTFERFSTLAALITAIEEHHAVPVDEGKLFNDLLHALPGLIDPYAEFFTADECAKLDEYFSPEIAGIGVGIGKNKSTGTIFVEEIIRGASAWEAGILEGDVISRIDDHSSFDRTTTVETARELLAGKLEERVTIHIIREKENLQFAVVRAKVKVPLVTGRMFEPGIAYVKIKKFLKGASEEFSDIIKRLTDENGKPLSGLILDLRNNSGGITEEAREVASVFLENGVVFFEDYRNPLHGGGKQEVLPGGTLKDLPLIVLVNKESASAAEIVAGALQDYHRAVIAGEETSGKGSIQGFIPLPEGNCLKLTTGFWYLPSGRSIQKEKIHPDPGYEWPQTKPSLEGTAFENDFQLYMSLHSLRAQLRPAEKPKEAILVKAPLGLH